MGRPQKQTVDYFPHIVNQGKTIFILENEFGNDGYAFWFKLLELLCISDGQKYDYSSPSSWRFLLAKTHVTEDIAIRILATLVDVDAIDKELNDTKVIWVQKLVDNLELVYSRRTDGKPQKPSSNQHKPLDSEVLVDKNAISAIINTQTIVHNTKQDNITVYGEFNNVKLSEEEHTKLIEKFGQRGTGERIENVSLYIKSKGDKYKSHYATILSWDRRDKGGQGGTDKNRPRKLPERGHYTKPENL